ncbi:hypothetical protein [Pelagibaculum spongiae]|uniref:Tle cognate immunity protein 4 C-terminal domain-containing protein n=1 Tax=Pelagibaculum spongiae TaxID=2080658 RepID=A0A2V1H239_9GAMM|nr:hypothetical protein [Pelagibaculum spongiae]PVZ72030.1 hypothetical protein DC094_03140 [Pelagibaculum spongiae]
MKKINPLTFLLTSSILVSCGTTKLEKTIDIQKKLISSHYKPFCIGRHTVNLPEDINFLGSNFRSHNLSTNFFPNRPESSAVGLFEGNERLSNWSASANKQALDYGDWQRKSVKKITDEEYQILSTHLAVTHHGISENMLKTYVTKDFSKLKKSIGFNTYTDKKTYSDTGFVNYQSEYSAYLKSLPLILKKYKNISLPHQKSGTCLTDNIFFETEQAANDEYLGVFYKRGEKSYFRFEFNAKAAESQSELTELLNRKMPNRNSYYARTTLTVAGHPGMFFVHSGFDSKIKSKFYWYALDAKVGSTRTPYISIQGMIYLDDFPEIEQLEHVDLDAFAMLMLKSLKQRENGMIGTK